MIKVANNIQRMLEKQSDNLFADILRGHPELDLEAAAETMMPNGQPLDYGRRIGAPRVSGPIQRPNNMSAMLPPDNLFFNLQNSMQQQAAGNPNNMNRVLQRMDQGYNDMVGPDGVPNLLRAANRFAGDAQQAAGPLAQDYGNILNQSGQYVNEVGNRYNNALDYVHQQIPAATHTAQGIANSANQFITGVSPAAQQAAQNANNAVQGVAGRLGSIGRDAGRSLMDAARMIGTGFPVPTMPRPAPVPPPLNAMPRPVPLPGPNGA